jgi:hypothetical protein
MNYDLDMPPYVDEMADWLDDEKKPHPCHGENAFKGLEIALGICRAVVNRGQVRLPLEPGAPELPALQAVLPDAKVICSIPASEKEYSS